MSQGDSMADSTNGASFSSLFTSYQVLCHTPIVDRDELICEMVRALGPALGQGQLDQVVKLWVLSLFRVLMLMLFLFSMR